MVKQTFERRDPAKLTNHLANIKIYGGKEPSKEFVDSCKDGIHTPLLILPDGTIISGHSRRIAANFWGHKDVPVIVRYDLADDPLLAELVLIQCNAQREKTNEQIAKEAARLNEIFTEFAKRRQKAGKPCAEVNTTSETAEKEAKGRSHEKVAETLGISKNAARNAAEVGKAIKDAEASGDTKAADDLKETVNKKGFGAAKKKAREQKAPPPAETPFDVPVLRAETVVKEYVPRMQEFAIEIERLLLANKGDFSADKISKAAATIHQQFDGVLRLLRNCQQKARR